MTDEQQPFDRREYVVATDVTYDDAAIGAALRQIRQQHDISQSDMARRLDVDQSTISRLEAGERHWSDEWIDDYIAVIDARRMGRQ